MDPLDISKESLDDVVCANCMHLDLRKVMCTKNEELYYCNKKCYEEFSSTVKEKIEAANNYKAERHFPDLTCAHCKSDVPFNKWIYKNNYSFCTTVCLRRYTDKYDQINHPKHYTEHPSGVECITITEHMSFTLGNAIKYIWRADLKNGVEDLKKAIWYLNRELKRRENGKH